MAENPLIFAGRGGVAMVIGIGGWAALVSSLGMAPRLSLLRTTRMKG